MASSGPVGPGHDPAAPSSGRIGRAESSSTFDESGLLSLGEQVDQANSSGRHSHKSSRPNRGRHRGLWWVLGSIGVVLVLLVGGTAGYGWYLNHEIRRLDVKGLLGVPSSGASAGTQNILLVGSTDRCALKVQNPAYGLCSQGVTGVNSDVVMVLHLNPAKRSLAILSIPRDLFVPNARTTGANKIDAALFEGPSQLVSAINHNLGIPIHHYVVLNFETFANVVDALGGVSMYFPQPVYDAYSGLKVLAPGCVKLDGLHALQVVRARHLQYKPASWTTPYPSYWPFENSSDLARIRRSHEFLRVLATAVAKNGLSDPITDGRLVSSVAPQLQVDKSFSPSDMVNMILDFRSINASKAPQLTLPVQVDQFGSYRYKGAYYGDIEFPSNVEDDKVIEQFLGLDAKTGTMTGKPLPVPSSVTVSILNGSGTANQATTTSTALGALGFNMVGVGDTPPVATHAETVVYFAKKTPEAHAAAQAVARSMSGAVITALGPTTNGAQVTVVTGTQFTVNPPAPLATAKTDAPASSASSNPPTSSAASTTTTTVPAHGAFQPPTPPVSPLESWDPRACPA